MTNNIYQKHLTIKVNNLIEQGLNEKKNFSEITKLINITIIMLPILKKTTNHYKPQIVQIDTVEGIKGESIF
jgi:hypothetical protein